MPALNSVTVPVGVIRPIRFPAAVFGEPHVPVRAGNDVEGEAACGDPGGELGDDSRRRDPPDPAAVGLGEPHVPVRARRDPLRIAVRLVDPGGEVLTTPVGLIRPIFWPMNSVNHMFPSGPAAIVVGSVPVSPPNSVTTPAGVIRPILFAVELGEPQVPVRARRDPLRAARRGDPRAVLRHLPDRGRRRRQHRRREHTRCDDHRRRSSARRSPPATGSRKTESTARFIRTSPCSADP